MSKHNHALKNKTCFTRFIFVQAAYQQAINLNNIADLIAQFQERHQHSIKKQIDWLLFQELLEALQKHQQLVDEKITKLTNGSSSEINMVNVAIIRCGITEIILGYMPLEPLISRYINIAMRIGTAKGYALVNGIFDKVAKSQLLPSPCLPPGTL